MSELKPVLRGGMEHENRKLKTRIEQLEAELFKTNKKLTHEVDKAYNLSLSVQSQHEEIAALEAERLALAELVLHLNRSLSRPLIGEEIIDVSKARSIVDNEQ